MLSSKRQHISVDLSASNQGTLDADLVPEDGEVWELEVVAGDGEWVDGGSWSQDWDVEAPVWGEGGADQEVVDWLAVELLDALGDDELGGTELHGLLAFALRRGENDNGATHLGGELDGQVAESTNTHDTDSVVWAGAEGGEGGVDGGSTAHQWGGEVAWDGVWDLEEELGVPDGVGTERSLVEVVGAEEVALFAKGLATSQTLVAVHAGVVLVAPANVVALGENSNSLTELLNNTGTLMTKTLVGLAEMLISTANTRVSDANQNLLWANFTGSSRLHDLTRLGALEDGKRWHV